MLRTVSIQIPASIMSRAMPMSSQTSSVRGVTPIARQKGRGSFSRSMIRGLMPCRASSPAMVSPTGPAPTTKTPPFSKVFDVRMKSNP